MISLSAAQGTIQFTEVLLRYESLMITSAAWVIIQAGSKGWPAFSKSSIGARLKPGASIVICTAMAFLPSFRLEGQEWDEALLLGIVLGSGLSHAHKILKQTGFGDDADISPRVNDPELQKVIDEYHAMKAANGSEEAKKTWLGHVKNLIT